MLQDMTLLSMNRVAAGLLGVGVIYVLSIVIYRLFFHPLAKYPGPFWAKLTDGYIAYHAWKGDRHIEFLRCHEKYGKFVRFGPSSLSVNSATALHTIYGFKANVRKADFYDAFPANPAARSTHSAIDRAQHARKRRVLSHAFADGAIREVERFVLANIRSFCEQLGRNSGWVRGGEGQWGKALNMSDWCDWLAFDIMGDLVFGKAFEMLEREENRFATQLVSNASHRHLICGSDLTIPALRLDKLLLPNIASARAQYMAFSKTQAASRTKLGADIDRRDIFHHLLHARDPETNQGFSTNELWGESNLLIIAGSDTTSTALAGTFFYLVHYPAALARATSEVRAAFDTLEDIQAGPTMNGCTFLRACLDEAMRMSPPVPGLLPRAVLPGGLLLDGETLPAGTVVGVCAYALHHSSSYFPDSFAYRPERWLGPAEEVERARDAFCPFSVGPRGCIGKGLAYVEMMATMARTLWAFDLRLAEGTGLGEGKVGGEWGRERREEFQLMDIFTSRKDGPLVQFRKRA